MTTAGRSKPQRKTTTKKTASKEQIKKIVDVPASQEFRGLLKTAPDATIGDRDKVFRTGCNGFISKSINPELFAKEVETVLTHENN